MQHCVLLCKAREMIMMLRSCCRDAVLRLSTAPLQQDLSIMKAEEEALDLTSVCIVSNTDLKIRTTETLFS